MSLIHGITASTLYPSQLITPRPDWVPPGAIEVTDPQEGDFGFGVFTWNVNGFANVAGTSRGSWIDGGLAYDRILGGTRTTYVILRSTVSSNTAWDFNTMYIQVESTTGHAGSSLVASGTIGWNSTPTNYSPIQTSDNLFTYSSTGNTGFFDITVSYSGAPHIEDQQFSVSIWIATT